MKSISTEEIQKRKMQLKEQCLQVRGTDRIDRIHRCMLIAIRKTLEEQINEEFDPVLSRKIDCISYLVEN